MNLSQHLKDKIFESVGKAALELGCEAFVIGGFVRDLILERPSKDVDFVVNGSGIELAKLTAKILGIKNVHYYKTFGTAAFKVDGLELEFVGARKESYNRESRKPIVENGTLEDDQNRRDFTINALAISLQKENFGELVDPFDGLGDLQRKLIKTPLDPDETFSDDPLRMMRAIRFASQLGFVLAPEVLVSIEKNRNRLEIVSKERIIIELNKIIASKIPSVGFKLLFDTKLLGEFFPEMTALYGVEVRNGVGHKDNFYHTLQVLDNVAENSDKLYLRWAAIMHDIAKPRTKRFDDSHGWTFHGHEDLGARMVPKIFRRLKLPLDQKMKYVAKLVFLHLRPIALTKETISDSAVRRLVFEAGDDIDDLMILCRADITSKNERKVVRYLKNYDFLLEKIAEVEEKDRVRNFQPPISGEFIMDTYKIGPCREIGTLKNKIKEAILEGDIENTFVAAEAYMRSEAEKLGLAKG